MLRTALNIILYYIILYYIILYYLNTFFFRKIVRNRAVSSYRRVCMQKKKKTCALSGI